MKTVSPFLMFQGNAKEALAFYQDVFMESMSLVVAQSDIEEYDSYQGSFTIKGQELRFLNSTIKHEFDFTPSFSLFIECDSMEEVDYLFNRLSANGSVLMELASYPFAEKYGWIKDQYGVSWQLVLN
ncbi:VOC family protein [Carnobacterium gallinarum]|uniref:VOC family protein n=1 Tax=Carnobacterium gallinarum TaxID=2749 RepID=UPI00055701A2|nr:VOC family protein [Carnobacterium gallinarum]